MNLLGAVLYDPSTAASKSTASLLAMTAFDTANLRVTVTVPAHGFLFFRIFGGSITGATTVPTILLGVLNGATVVGRVAPRDFPGTMNATTQTAPIDCEFVATGLAAGSTSFDLAYAVQVVVASTSIKYGGPNTNAGANAWGGIAFEVWDPQPLTTGLAGGVNVKQWNGTNVATPATAGVPDVNVKNINNVATTSVTTINANVGQTQPVNFTGTGASALVKSDMVDIAGAAVATGTAQIGVNVVNAAGTAWGSGAITAASIADAALNGKGDWATVNPTNLTAAQIATGIWQDATAGDFTAASSIGKSVMNGVALGTGLTVNDITTKTGYSLAANQHVIVDSGTVTTLTNLPAITAGWLTATGIAAAALNGKGDWLLSSSYTAPDNTRPANFTSLAITVGGVVSASGNWAIAGDAMTLTAAYDFAKGTTAIAESYRVNGAAPTPAQALCEILAHLGEASISGTVKTVNKFDHLTGAATFTLNDAAAPTSITRAT